jgi:hypothetical protein
MAIGEMRDYFLDKGFSKFHETKTLSNSNGYSRMMAEFYSDVFSCDAKNEIVLNPTGLKNLIRKKF